jgi:hypothetical protein
MKSRTTLFIFLVMLLFLLSACSLFSVQAAGQTNTPTPFYLLTSIPQTEVALANFLSTLTATPTETPTVTVTPTPVSTNTPTSTPASANVQASLPCYRAVFIGDVTIPDGTTFNPGDAFTKTWQLQNGGTCTWTTSFRLIFDQGNSMSGPGAVNLPANVIPGQTVNVSVNLVAPGTNGSYTGYWKLQTDQGTTFGIDPGANSDIWVSINVNSSVPTLTPTAETSFEVTSVMMSVDTKSATVDCRPGHRFDFTADITTNGAGTVTYYWERSDGSTTSEDSIDFSAAGTQSVSMSWDPGRSGIVSPDPFHGWVRIYIDNPNHQYFSKRDFTLTCKNDVFNITPTAMLSPTPTYTPTPKPATVTPTIASSPTTTSTPAISPTPKPATITSTPKPATATPAPKNTPTPKPKSKKHSMKPTVSDIPVPTATPVPTFTPTP